MPLCVCTDDLRKEFAELPNREPPGRTTAAVAAPVVAAAATAAASQAASARPALQASAFNRVRSTGMGIPICVQLAALMGGSLELADRIDGPGAGGAPTCNVLLLLPMLLLRVC